VTAGPDTSRRPIADPLAGIAACVRGSARRDGAGGSVLAWHGTKPGSTGSRSLVDLDQLQMAVLGLGRGAVTASLPVRSVSWCGPTRRLGGQVAPWPGGAQARRSSRVQACCQGQARGRCSTTRRPELAIRAGTTMRVRRMVPVVAVASCGPLSAAAGAGEVEREHCEHQPGGVGGERAAGQVCQGGVLQVGVDLFDDGVAAVGTSAATVSRLLVVKKAWYRHRSNSPSWPFGLSSGMRRTTPTGPAPAVPSGAPRRRRRQSRPPRLETPSGRCFGRRRRPGRRSGSRHPRRCRRSQP
jgi:hypothetical protein